MGKIENYLKELLKDNSWKAPAVAGVVTLLVLLLLDSVLFALIVALLKFLLILATIALFMYAAYLAYPIVLKKLKEARTK